MSAKREPISEHCFYNVQGWMTRLTKQDGRVLSLPEFTIYAIIYGFSQDGDSLYRGGLRFIMEFLNMSKPTVSNHLKALAESGLVLRVAENVNGVDFVNYSVNFDMIKNLTGGKESLPGVKNLDEPGKEILPGGGKESLPIILNKENKENKDIDACATAPATGAAAPVSKSLVFDIDDNDEKSGEAATPTPGPAAPAPAAPAKAKKAAKAPAFDFAAALIARGASEDRAREWTAARKRLGGMNTERAFNKLVPEFELAAKAGYTINDCLDKILYSGKVWIGFEAKWMDEHRAGAYSRPAAPAAPAPAPKPVRRF